MLSVERQVYDTIHRDTIAMATNFKLYFNNEDIRRIRLEKPSWDAFRNKLHQLYPEYSADLMIKYRDEEGDLITVTTSREWDSMLQSSDTTSPLKLFIFESGKPAAVEEEEEQIVEVLEEEEAEEEEIPPLVADPKEEEPVAAETVPEAPTTGQVPIEAEKEPEQPQVTIPEGETSASQEVPESRLSVLETDLEAFLDNLQRQACAFLNPEQNEALKKAKEFFQGLVPENPPVMSELSGVVDSVKRAFSNGYDNLRDLPEFNDFLDLFALGKEQDPKKYIAQNETLEAMGFVDVETNLALLVKYRGNLQRVVDSLLAA